MAPWALFNGYQWSPRCRHSRRLAVNDLDAETAAGRTPAEIELDEAVLVVGDERQLDGLQIDD